MKKILIVDKSFAVGGIQTALINMVKELKSDYKIDVLMFYNKGVLREYFPKDVNIIEPNYFFRLHGMSISDSKNEGLITYLSRIGIGILDKIISNRFSIWFALLFQKKLKGYDVAIAFHHEDSINASVSGFYRFVQKKTDAKIKLGWIHYDPRYVTFNDSKNIKYMKKMDKIICVSKGTADNFINCHPELLTKVDFCYNFHDIERIKKLIKEEPILDIDDNKFNCFSACRLTEQKAIPRAIKSFAPVLHKYKDVVWYIAGDGRDEEECKKIIKEEKLDKQIILLGAVKNPYSFMKKCDIYIQPSIYEAAPMVYGEALICKIPIFTTENISSTEMVDSRYGIICKNNANEMERTFNNILNNRGMVKTMKRNLEDYQFSNKNSLQKFYELTSRIDN